MMAHVRLWTDLFKNEGGLRMSFNRQEAIEEYVKNFRDSYKFSGANISEGEIIERLNYFGGIFRGLSDEDLEWLLTILKYHMHMHMHLISKK